MVHISLYIAIIILSFIQTVCDFRVDVSMEWVLLMEIPVLVLTDKFSFVLQTKSIRKSSIGIPFVIIMSTLLDLH